MKYGVLLHCLQKINQLLGINASCYNPHPGFYNTPDVGSNYKLGAKALIR
jgi:hypothetical protein